MSLSETPFSSPRPGQLGAKNNTISSSDITNSSATSPLSSTFIPPDSSYVSPSSSQLGSSGTSFLPHQQHQHQSPPSSTLQSGGVASYHSMSPSSQHLQEVTPSSSQTNVGQKAAAADTVSSHERKVVVAIDDNSASTNALKWTVKQLIYPPRDRLIILTVGAYKSSYMFGGGAEKVARKEQKAEERSDRVLANANTVMEVMQNSGKAKISFELVALKAVDNDVRDVITDYVKDTSPDLLVMGSHGANALKRSILGSTSSYLLHHSPCPVIIVKEQGATAV